MNILRLLSIFTLLLTYSCNKDTQVEAIILDKEPQKNEKNHKLIFCLGDSLTAGYGLKENEAWPAQLQSILDEKKLKWIVLNAGKSGATSAGGLRAIAWLTRQKIDILIIALGANDGLRGLKTQETQNNLEQIILAARKSNPQIKILLTGMQVPPNMGAEYSSAFKAIFPKLAQEQKCAFLPFLLEGVAGIAAMNQADGIHPTAAGQKIMCDNIWLQIQKIIAPAQD